MSLLLNFKERLGRRPANLPEFGSANDAAVQKNADESSISNAYGAFLGVLNANE